MVNPGIYMTVSPSKSWPWKSWRLTARPGLQLIKDKLVMNKLALSSANIGWRGKCVVEAGQKAGWTFDGQYTAGAAVAEERQGVTSTQAQCREAQRGPQKAILVRTGGR